MKFHVFKDTSGSWRWHVVSSNGQVIATCGEGFKTKAHAFKMASKVSGVDVIQLVHNNITLALNEKYGSENSRRQMELALAALEKARSRVVVVGERPAREK